MNCVFNWNATVSYFKVNGGYAIGSFCINVASLSLTFTGVTAFAEGIKYSPNDCSMLRQSSDSYSTLKFEIDMHEIEFTVKKYRPDQYGNMVLIGEGTERKRLKIEYEFEMDNSIVAQKIHFKKCQIVAKSATDYSAV